MRALYQMVPVIPSSSLLLDSLNFKLDITDIKEPPFLDSDPITKKQMKATPHL